MATSSPTDIDRTGEMRETNGGQLREPLAKTRRRASLAIVCAGVLWGTMGIFVHVFNAVGLSALDISELRAIGCAAVMFVVLLVRDRHLPHLRLRDVWCFLGTGLLSILLFNVCYFATIASTSMSVAAVLLYTAPAFVMLMSRVLFKERFTRPKVLALVLTVIGCFLSSNVLGSGATITAFGLFTGIMSGIGYALYTIFSRYALERGYDPLTIVFFTYLVTALGGAIIADFSQMGVAFSSSWRIVAVALVYVVVTTALPYTLYTLGLIHTGNSRASIIVSIEPVAATVFGFVFFSETPSLLVLLGMACVLGGIVIVNLRPRASEDVKGVEEKDVLRPDDGKPAERV
jgi:DME family drug/metabolite transporter